MNQNANNPAGNDAQQSRPFWMPWGGWGYMWRYLVFLLLLGLFCALLGMMRGCNRQPSGDDPYNTNLPGTEVPDSLNQLPTYEDPYNSVPNDTAADDDLSIIPDLLPEDITEPDRYGHRVAARVLNILMDVEDLEQMRPTMEAWSQAFKQAYPDDAYKVIYRNPATGFMQISVPADVREQVKAELNAKLPNFNFKVFEEEVLEMSMVPSDPAFSSPEASWWFPAVQLYDAWDITMGSEDVIVGIVDSYFDLRHPEFRNKRIIAPYSMDNGNSNVMNPAVCEEGVAEHGCNVSSIAVGSANNGVLLCGVAPKCRMLPVSVMIHGRNQTTGMRMAEGVMYCILHGADVVNISLGFGADLSSYSLEEQLQVSRTMFRDAEVVWDYVFEMADRRNCTLVWACGNETSLAGIDASKRSDKTIRVSALDTRLRPAEFTNYGNFPDQGVNYSTVSAPGVDMLGAAQDFSYCVMAGTSQAAPVVTGAVALMKSLDPNLTTQEIIDILVETGRPIQATRTEECVGPLIQIRDALERVRNRVPVAREVFEDPSKMAGIWKCDTQLSVEGEPIQFFLALSEDKTGTVYAIIDGAVLESPVTWEVNSQQQQLRINTTGTLKCPQYEKTNITEFVLVGKAGEDGRLTLEGRHPDGHTFDCGLAQISTLNLRCTSCNKQFTHP